MLTAPAVCRPNVCVPRHQTWNRLRRTFRPAPVDSRTSGYEARSIGDSFQILRPSSIRDSSRRVCSSGLTSIQYFERIISGVDHRLFHLRRNWRNRFVCSSVQKPITRSTPAQLYQTAVEDDDLACGRQMRHVALKYICDFRAPSG